MTTIYVSPTGNGDGSQTSPCSFESLEALINEKRQNAQEDVTVLFADGHYQVRDGLLIEGQAQQSAHWLRLKAEKGACAVLSSGQQVTEWALHDATANIWKASVPAGTDFEHLWSGHKRLTRAWSGWNPPGFKNTKRGLKMTKGAMDVASWGNLNDVTVTKKMMWRKMPATISGVQGRHVQLDKDVTSKMAVPRTALGVMEFFSLYGLLNFLSPRGADYAFENAYELLTDEGEWYLDRAESVLYYKPFADQNFSAGSELTYASVNTFIKLNGSIQAPVSKVEISGLRFQYAKGSKFGVTAGFPTEPTQFDTPTPAACLQVNRGVDIEVRDNQFLHMGYDALHFDLGGSDYKISGNAFIDVSRSALSLNQTNLLVSNKSKRGVLPENRNKFFERVVIDNNYMRVSGLDAAAPAISYSEFTRDLKCLHNDISFCATQAIRNSWRYLGWRGHCGDIEYAWNRTADVGQDGLVDFGAIYVACANVGYTKIHHNYIDGVGVNPANAGIYLDVFVDGGEINHNVSVNQPVDDFWNRLSRGWVALVMSKNSRVNNNWSDELSFRDFDQGRLRFFWGDRSNKLVNNHKLEDISRLPVEAQEIADKAGLEVPYQAMKQALEKELLGS